MKFAVYESSFPKEFSSCSSAIGSSITNYEVFFSSFFSVSYYFKLIEKYDNLDVVDFCGQYGFRLWNTKIEYFYHFILDSLYSFFLFTKY